MQRTDRGGKKLLYSYFSTYLAVLLIPMLTACICYFRFSQAVQADIENENRTLLTQAVTVLDMQLQQASDYSIRKMNSPTAYGQWYADRQRLASLLDTLQLDPDDIACAESPDGALLAFSGQGEQAAEALRAFLRDQPGQMDLTKATINGRDMLISRTRSDRTGLTVAIARSPEGMFARLNRLRWALTATLLAAALLALGFSYLFSRRNAACLSRLAFGGTAQALGGMSYGKAFSSLRQSLEDIRTAHDHMEQTLANQRPYLQRSFLTQLLDGDFEEEENAWAIADSLSGIRLESPMRVVLMHFSGGNEDARDLRRFVNGKAVIRLAVESLEADALHMSRSESDYVLLLSGSRLQERIEALVRMVRENLPCEVDGSFRVCVGNPVDRLTEVVRSWDNASSMVYLPPAGGESVQYYQESGDRQPIVFYPQDMQRRLVNAVMGADEAGVREILAQLREQNRRGAAIPDYIARLLADSLLSTLLQINAMAGLPAEKSNEVLAGVQSLMTLPAEAQLDTIGALYGALCAAVRQTKGDGCRQQSIDEVTAYIDGHYMDADLSLAGVADRFHMSESYLSCLFKAQTGTNFFSYVEDLRIARAKTLLRETNLKINEIAQQSGYASANSFCRAFKRNTGESATNYRNGTFTP